MGRFFMLAMTWIVENLLAKILTSAGLALLGSVALTPFVQYFINKALQALSYIPMLGLIGVAGIDKAISILVSCAMIRLYLSTVMQGISITKAKK